MKYRIILLLILFAVQLNFTSANNQSNITDTIVDAQNQDDEFDEFEDFEESKDANLDDEFEDFDEANDDDEFEEFDEFDDSDTTCPEASKCAKTCGKNETYLNKALIWVLGILGFTILAGIFVRFEYTRKFRNIFLLSAIIVLGFSELHHACPCMLSSFQRTFLWIFGYDIDWRKMIWFLGLIPITYIFGQVWCGWVCHLGALQEFLYLPGKVKIFRGERAQKTMKIIRWVLFVALLIQLFVENRLFFCKIDPFKTVFDLGFLGSKYLITRWVLLILLLLSSLFIYRPFCKAVCPVGLVLGWISKIPGASVLGIGGKCAGCSLCNKACDMDAITHHGKFSIIDNKECISCGECIDSCKKKGLDFFRKSKKHPDKIECKNECKV
ncbi:MAG: 4Fe-4S binding protein [Bacteroidota bacterium]|nr:4Fe-4S binding protein [Bacteroidota bacterium]